MALATITLACLLYYASSKYFPWYEALQLEQCKGVLVGIASAIALLAFYLFTLEYDWATALMIWSMALMTLLCAVILSIKLNDKWIWAWGALGILFLVIELV